jgi:hypothetical protein
MVMALALASRAGLFLDAIQVVMRLPRVERWRSMGPETATALARRMGRRATARSLQSRSRLRRVIGFVDRLLGANCYRRVLLELALDREAAGDPIYLGIRGREGGGPGHAWRGHDARLEAQYEAVFRIS